MHTNVQTKPLSRQSITPSPQDGLNYSQPTCCRNTSMHSSFPTGFWLLLLNFLLPFSPHLSQTLAITILLFSSLRTTFFLAKKFFYGDSICTFMKQYIRTYMSTCNYQFRVIALPSPKMFNHFQVLGITYSSSYFERHHIL